MMSGWTPASGKAFGPDVRRYLVIGLVVLAALVYLGNRGEASEPSAGVSEASVTLAGTGTKNTAPFTLAGGDYTVSWTATAATHVGCYHSAHLEPTSGGRSQDAGSGMFKDAETHSDQTNLYGVAPGQYYVAAISGCAWTIAFSHP